MRRRLLSEEKINSQYVDKIFKLIENDLSYHPFEGLSIDIGQLNNLINKGKGINVTLKKDGHLGKEFINTVKDIYGTTEEESKILWDKVRIYLKKLSFIEHVSYILYEDWIKWEKNPYIIQNLDELNDDIKYKINKLGDFIKFMYYTGVGKKEYDPHSEESINFLELLDEDDFEYIQSEVFRYIGEDNSDDYLWGDDTTNINESRVTEDGDILTLNDNIFDKKIYNKLSKYLDTNREDIFDSLKVLDIEYKDIDKPFLEANIIYKYLTEYENRTPLYIQFELDSEDISDLFYDDRDYDIKGMVKNYLDGDYDYGYDTSCFDVDDWLINKINSENMGTLKSIYEESLDGEEGNEEDFIEFIKNEFDSEIGCSAGDAQFSADIDSLHNDFIRGIEDYLSNFDGHIASTRDGVKFVGTVEVGELVNSPYFEDLLIDWLEGGYPSSFLDIFYDIKGKELTPYSSEYNYFFPEDLIRFNTDKHFRYGGAGDIDWGYFNEILSDRLSNI
jgi:hypothetical protein